MNYKALEKAKIISFDIFDTLLIRNVSEPNRIFELIEEIYGWKNFKERRLNAAEKAKHNYKNGEANLYNIYECLEEAPQVELEMESRYLQANLEIKKIYNWCKINQKKIIAVSDMYLPSKFLNEILSKNGIVVDKIFVSCEEKCSKASGQLFDVVIDKCGVQPSDIVHIGDSWKSDFISPIKHGIQAIHYKKIKQSSSIVACITNNNKTDDYFYNIGYSVMGPLVVGFVRWIKKELEANQIEDILFLARDGKILKEAFEEIYGIKTNYVYVSRQSLNTCTLWMHSDFDDVKKIVIRTEHTSIGKFIKRLGLEVCDFLDVIEKNGLDVESSFSDFDFWNDLRVKSIYEEIKDKVIENSKVQYKYFFDYISPYLNTSKVALVDLGWKGTIQERFCELILSTTKYKNIRVLGYYYGIEKDIDNVNGYFYKGKTGKERKIAIDAGFGLFETMFLAREGTTLSYSADGVVLDSYEVTSPKEYKKLMKIHKGAMNFVQKVKECKLNEVESEWNNYDSFSAFEQLALFPHMDDLINLGSVGFKDTDEVCLIKRASGWHYLFNIRKLLMDYHAAPWKIGFLKVNISGWFPWGWIYKKVK